MSLKKDKKAKTSKTSKKVVSKPKTTKTVKKAKSTKLTKKSVSKRVAQLLWKEYRRKERRADENIPTPGRENDAPETPMVFQDQDDFMDVTDLKVESSKGIIAKIRAKAKQQKYRVAWKKRWNYPRDPHWIIARWPGMTDEGTPFKKGDKVLYFPLTKSFMVGPAADAAWRQFQAELFDEIQYNRGVTGGAKQKKYRLAAKSRRKDLLPDEDPDDYLKEHGVCPRNYKMDEESGYCVPSKGTEELTDKEKKEVERDKQLEKEDEDYLEDLKQKSPKVYEKEKEYSESLKKSREENKSKEEEKHRQLIEKRDQDPDAYREEFGKCPPGFRYDSGSEKCEKSKK